MSIVTDLILVAKSTINSWHNNNYKWFEFSAEDNFQDVISSHLPKEISITIQKHAFHNYCGWHFIEEYNNQNQDVVHFVYHGGLDHNVQRNLCMEKIDEYFCSLQKNTGVYNSEGFGSIFDRITNDYIKYIHLVEIKDPRAENFYEQIIFLEKSAESLYEEVINGNRRIMIFRKFKIKGY